jgi:hypothetical protein
MTLGHSCINVATRTVEAQGYPGLVAMAGERWPVGQNPKPLEQQSLGPNEASILGKGLSSEAPGGGK